MNCEVVLTRSFKRSVKRLAKRFPHVKADVRTAIHALLQSPNLGVRISGGSGVRNTDLSKGKGGGYRLLCYMSRANWCQRSICSCCTRSQIEMTSPCGN